MAISAPEPIIAEHDVEFFDCGKPALDIWLKTRALRNQRESFTAVRVVHDEMKVIGFYGLAPTAVAPPLLPRSVRTGQPPDPVPCILLGQLAVDKRYKGQGVGIGLVKHALTRTVQAAELIGGAALLVNALDTDAAAFWRSWGFIATRDDPLILCRSITKIRASLAAS
jgi:GNAT superfamily N-acetyltransferase